MRKVYLSFLGLGDYTETVYHLNGKESVKTGYVQCAEISILGKDYFDICLFVVTPQSLKKHFDKVKEELKQLGVTNVLPIQINESLEPRFQWEWFEKILYKIDRHDSLTLDMTHGYRAAPIIISAAINFLQKAKNVRIDAVYYGAFERNRNLSPIIDMKEFYEINEWAEAVSRLVEDADARKMADVAGRTDQKKIGELNEVVIVQTLNELTNAVRNVDINNIPDKAKKALELIREKQKNASPTGKMLLDLVVEKFISISSGEFYSREYDREYFRLQLEIIRLLIDHKLYMQAFTVMREFVGSIGLIEVKKANMRNEKGRKQRTKADCFINMLSYPEEKWRFGDEDFNFKKVFPFYEKLKGFHIEYSLRTFTEELVKYRNGLDHAWTQKREAYTDIEEKGEKFYQHLNQVISELEKNQIL